MSDIHSQPASDAYRENWDRVFASDPIAESKRLWREHPEMPGYCTINCNGSSITPHIKRLSQEIRSEFGECHIINYFNGCPILNEDANA